MIIGKDTKLTHLKSTSNQVIDWLANIVISMKEDKSMKMDNFKIKENEKRKEVLYHAKGPWWPHSRILRTLKHKDLKMSYIPKSPFYSLINVELFPM